MTITKNYPLTKKKGSLLKFFPYIGFQIGKSNLLLEIASIGSIIAVKKGLVFHIIGTLCRQLILYLPVDILHPYPSFFFQSYLLDFLTTICSQIVNLGMKRILKKIVEKSVVPPFYKKKYFSTCFMASDMKFNQRGYEILKCQNRKTFGLLQHTGIF